MRAIIENFIFRDITTMAMVMLFGLPILVFLLIGYKKLFNKCNEKGWQAFIPLYNTYILGEIAGVHWYYSLIANSFFIIETLEFYDYEIVFYLVSLLGKFIINYNIGKIFHKDYTYVILMTILPFPMYTILGYSKSIANLNIKLTKNGPIDSRETLYDTPEIIEEPITEKVIPKKIKKPKTNKLDNIKTKIVKKIETKKNKKIEVEKKTVEEPKEIEIIVPKKEIKAEASTTPPVVKTPSTIAKTTKETVKNKTLTKEELNTYDIPIINVSFDKDSIPNSNIIKEDIVNTKALSDDELLDIILKKKKAVKRLKQRKKNNN